MTTPTLNTEKLRHKLALELEARKWEYRRLEIQYLEAGQHFRSLNQLMWQIPGMAIAITGGLWYGASTVTADQPRAWVFSFVAIVDVLTIVILWRIRHLIQNHINYQSLFAGKAIQDEGKRTVIKCWSATLFAAAVISVVAACNPEVFVTKQVPDKSVCCNITVDLQQQECKSIIHNPAPQRRTPRKQTPCNQ